METLHETRVKAILDEIQKEWEIYRNLHTSRYQDYSIRSSQISALVGYLIEKGIIKDDYTP